MVTRAPRLTSCHVATRPPRERCGRGIDRAGIGSEAMEPIISAGVGAIRIECSRQQLSALMDQRMIRSFVWQATRPGRCVPRTADNAVGTDHPGGWIVGTGPVELCMESRGARTASHRCSRDSQPRLRWCLGTRRRPRGMLPPWVHTSIYGSWRCRRWLPGRSEVDVDHAGCVSAVNKYQQLWVQRGDDLADGKDQRGCRRDVVEHNDLWWLG